MSINDDRVHPLSLLAGRPWVEPADAQRGEAARRAAGGGRLSAGAGRGEADRGLSS
ncbi:hypothetical protein KQS06HV_140016 [Klebsiella quasipneumoniae subsp. similipneumoniae]|nr:hypothetical protein KQS06HV_140016 [Klebsiella quasipneumoniae subsp. similipneumoniae]